MLGLHPRLRDARLAAQLARQLERVGCLGDLTTTSTVATWNQEGSLENLQSLLPRCQTLKLAVRMTFVDDSERQEELSLKNLANVPRAW